jgi:hypothetical protein
MVRLPAHVILGRGDILHFGFLSPRFHRCCSVSRTSSRIRLSRRIYHTHVGVPNCAA